MIARDNGDALTVSGDDPFVADYLYRESLSQLPEQTQRFLRRTALLDPLCASLCDAVLGESGSQEQLRGLEASNLFLIPLDRRREWYRYHSLFREFLLGEQRRIEPEIIPKLDLRAADWHESHGSPEMALEHLLNTTEIGPLRSADDGVAAPDLPSRADVDGAAVAVRGRRPRDRAVSPARRAGRLAGGPERGDHRSPAVGGDHRRCVVRAGAGGRHGVVRLLACHAASRHV